MHINCNGSPHSDKIVKCTKLADDWIPDLNGEQVGLVWDLFAGGGIDVRVMVLMSNSEARLATLFYTQSHQEERW